MRILKFIKRQILYLKKRQWTALFLFLWFPISIPAVFIIRLIRPFLLVRLFRFQGYCMGALIRAPDTYLRGKVLKLDLPKERTLDFFYVGPKIANTQLLIMWKRLFPKIHEGLSYWFFYSVEWVNYQIPGWEDHITGKFTVHYLLGSIPPYLKFTDEEEIRGRAGLHEMGLPPGAPFVGLLVRDNAHMANFLPETDDSSNECRNCDIDNFILASQELVNLGYYVVRMGAKVSKSLKINNEKIIDYASSSFRNEFMDMYLAKNCELFISTGCGFDLAPNYLFNKPSVYCNLFRMDEIFHFRNFPVFTVKIIEDPTRGHRFSLRELFDRKSFRTQVPDNSVRYIENSPEEVRDSIIEGIERLRGTWKPHPEDEELQKRFWSFFHEIEGGIPAHFSAHFLRKHHEWFLK